MELQQVEKAPAAYSFYLLPHGAGDEEGSVRSGRTSASRGNAWPSITRLGRGLWISFSNLADFVFIAEERVIRCYAYAEAPLTTIRHLLLDQVMPVVGSQQTGRVVMHAGAVVVDGNVLAFLGPSGHGKSSLVGSFCQGGYSFFSDDSLMVEMQAERALGFFSYPAIRLWPNAVSAIEIPQALHCEMAHYSEKKLLAMQGLDKQFTHGIPLKRLYFLTSEVVEQGKDEVSIEPVRPRDALLELTQCLFRFDPYDRAKFREEFLLLGRIVSSVPVYRLSYPRRFDRLPAVRDAVLKNLEL